MRQPQTTPGLSAAVPPLLTTFEANRERETWVRTVDRFLDVFCRDASGRRMDCGTCGQSRGERCGETMEAVVAELAALMGEVQRANAEADRLRALLAQALDHVPADHPLAAEGMTVLS